MDKLHTQLEGIIALAKVTNDLGGINPKVGVVDMEYAEYLGRQVNAKVDNLLWLIGNAESELAQLRERAEVCRRNLIV